MMGNPLLNPPKVRSEETLKESSLAVSMHICNLLACWDLWMRNDYLQGQICRHTLRDLGFLILSSFPSSSVKMRTLD